MNKAWMIFDCFSVGMLLALSANLLGIFFSAHASENKSCLVTINDYNEAKIESVLFPIFFIMGVITMIRLMMEVPNPNYYRTQLADDTIPCCYC